MRKKSFFSFLLSLLGRALWRLFVLAFFVLLTAFSTVCYGLPVCLAASGVAALVLAAALFVPGNPAARVLWRPRFMRILTAFVLVLLIAATPACLAFAYASLPSAAYASVDSGFAHSAFLRDKYVLVLVPHEDDDVNMAGATIQHFVDAGSEVYVAFVTNGDSIGLSSERLYEAVACMDELGVPRENVYFLGYGDDWQGTHLYNRAPDEAALSLIGRDRTYGTAGLRDFATEQTGEAHLYTRANCLSDIRTLVDLLFPDVIFCIDYDPHADHRMTSLLFEEAMGQLLNENPAYRPQVFKGLTYLTGWVGPRDFYTRPMTQTVSPDEPTWPLGTPAYRWSERVRFPVPVGYASYTLRANRVYALHSLYPSQSATLFTASVANSDQVFFERATDSLLYGERIEAASGDASVLTDFKLFDTTDVRETRFDAGVWTPAEGQRTVRCTFSSPQSLNTLTLWDNPDPAQNVLAATLTLSDGTIVEIPALDPLGASTTISFEQRDGIEWAELTLRQVEGDAAGLTEWELALREARDTAFVKLTDAQGEFLYEAPAAAGESIALSLYAWPALPEGATFSLTVTDEARGQAFSTAGLTADDLTVGALERGTYRVRVACEQDEGLYDECVLRVGDPMLKERLLQWFEPRYDALLKLLREKTSYAI